MCKLFGTPSEKVHVDEIGPDGKPTGRFALMDKQAVEKLMANQPNPVRDFEYYIAEASKAEQRSEFLWKAVASYIRGVLQRCQREGKTLAEAADILTKAAGKPKKNEPSSWGNMRTAARQIRDGEEFSVL